MEDLFFAVQIALCRLAPTRWYPLVRPAALPISLRRQRAAGPLCKGFKISSSSAAKARAGRSSQKLRLRSYERKLFFVVLEFHPQFAIGKSSPESSAFWPSRKTHRGRPCNCETITVPCVHDERAVRLIKEYRRKHLLLFNVADGFVAGLRSLCRCQAHRNLQRPRTFIPVLRTPAGRTSTAGSPGRRTCCRSPACSCCSAALLAKHVAHMNGSVITMAPQCTQAVRRWCSPSVAALALPVADGEVDEVQLRDAAEVRVGRPTQTPTAAPSRPRSWQLSICRTARSCRRCTSSGLESGLLLGS